MLILHFSLFVLTGSAHEFNPEKAGFAVKFSDVISPYKIFSIFVLPEEEVTIEVSPERGRNSYDIEAASGKLLLEEVNKWRWQAPSEKGIYTIKISHDRLIDSMTLNIFVMVPFNEQNDGFLNGYRIGAYPRILSRKFPIYKPPRGFIEVSRENEDTFVSPHFKVKQFLCKQGSGYPKYIVIKEKLLLKLEFILERVNKEGYKATTFNILSGYRTPHYNDLIGNVKYSRHIYGGAADIFIDENPRDDMMDDLNNDGRIDYRDAAIIYDIIDGMYGKPWYQFFVGGLGRYRKTPVHGPFVHIDVRGFRARWGT